jgi:N-methylhydantoinase A
MSKAALAVDIGGTFTDIVLEAGDRRFTHKLLTTPAAPEQAVLDGIAAVLAQAELEPAAIDLILHGTTLATNAIIERAGAKTALIVTAGFRDSVEMAYENRFEQYDINVERPAPLVPRHLRWPVTERMAASGTPVTPLDEATVAAWIPEIARHGIESLAIGLLHAYANPAHERRTAEIIAAALPDLPITLASTVCPEIREYERLSTACANAYIQPLVARYLSALDAGLKARGFACPILLMMSSGGLATIDTAIHTPIRLVESGPAGGAILARHIAAERDLDRLLSFDMGGTTAKICLIDDGEAETSRTFEVARAYRFTRGSGLPLRIPVIEMVEIGAGGGSIARVDSLQRIQVGPESAGADPGPAAYRQGGELATVTDADIARGRIDPDGFAGGTITLDPIFADAALQRAVGDALDLDAVLAAFAVSEVVDENMANAARVHAVERGRDLTERAMVAFGGAAPLHAARLAEKLGIDTVIIPDGAGVGSAIGFLRAPVAFELVRSLYGRLGALDAAAVAAMFDAMHAEAEAVVRLGAPDEDLLETRTAFMRYLGQGHEISVPVPLGTLGTDQMAALREAFETAYRAQFGLIIPDVEVEVLNWSLLVATPPQAPAKPPTPDARPAPKPSGTRSVFDTTHSEFRDVPVYARADLAPGTTIPGPAVITEAQTTTIVSSRFNATIDGLGTIILQAASSASDSPIT